MEGIFLYVREVEENCLEIGVVRKERNECENISGEEVRFPKKDEGGGARRDCCRVFHKGVEAVKAQVEWLKRIFN